MTFFQQWLSEAINSDQPEPTAMTLCTVGASGKPSARMVLLKGIEGGNLHIYTNYESRKAQDIAVNPFVAVVFFWPILQRQVRIEGEIQKLPEEKAIEYFNSRPFESKLSAIVSPQSREIQSKEELLQQKEELLKQSTTIVKPAYWGGYQLLPERIEFWQGRSGRFHDRVECTKVEDQWVNRFLAP